MNLAPDKKAVFKEMARVLKSGGRVALSDLALKKPLPPQVANDISAYVGCIGGAIAIEEYRDWLTEAGFAAVQVIDAGVDLNAYAQVEQQAGCCSPAMGEGSCSTESIHVELTSLLSRFDINEYVASVKVLAVRPQTVTI